MAEPIGPVGPDGGAPEDVARIQALLAHARLRRRGFWSGKVDGRMGAALRAAIEVFQYEAGLLAPPLAEAPGRIAPGGPTLAALFAAAPADLSGLRAAPGTAPGSATAFLARRSAPALEAEIARLDATAPGAAPALRAALAALLRRCDAAPGVRLVPLGRRPGDGRADFRFGIADLSVVEPGGSFRAVPPGDPAAVPAALWRAVHARAAPFRPAGAPGLLRAPPARARREREEEDPRCRRMSPRRTPPTSPWPATGR